MLQPQTTPPRQKQTYELKAGERSIIFGMTGSGKSHFAKFLDRAWFKQYDPREPERFWPILIYDPDWGWFRGTRFTYAEQPELSTVESPWNITPAGKLHPTGFIPVRPAEGIESLGQSRPMPMETALHPGTTR